MCGVYMCSRRLNILNRYYQMSRLFLPYLILAIGQLLQSCIFSHRIGAYYMPNFTNGFNSSNIDFSKVTHVFHCGLVAYNNGTLDVAKNVVEPELIIEAHKYGTKVLITVGAYEFDVFVNATAREIFAKNAVDFMMKYDYDGIDVDYEVPNNVLEAREYSNFFSEVRALLPPSGLLSCAVTSRPNVIF